MKCNKPLQVILRTHCACRLVEAQTDCREDDPSSNSGWQAAGKTVRKPWNSHKAERKPWK